MLLASFLLVGQNRGLLVEQEREILVAAALRRSQELDEHLGGIRRQLSLMGQAIVVGGEADLSGRLAEPWVTPYLESLSREYGDGMLLAGAFEPMGRGVSVMGAGRRLPAAATAALATALERASGEGRPVYEFVRLGERPAAVVAVPIRAGATAGETEPVLVMEALVRLSAIGGAPADGEGEGEPTGGRVSMALLGRDGEILWSDGMTPQLELALSESYPVRSFRQRPMSGLGQYTAPVDGGEREMVVQVSTIDEVGWGLATQKPEEAAFQAADRLLVSTLVMALLVVLIALVLAAVVARWLSGPVQQLAETSHQIADGNFGRRVEVAGLTAEFGELADDFNRMSGHVERYVEDLKRAAQANRELFIGSLRAFAAAIDAKDPYTRGHSERVAALSRTVAGNLGLAEEMRHKVWIAALLHDVGKIGVDDRILKKGGVLTDEEFAQMKLHTVVGAEILNPIVDLREIIPAVRWHHENWNGRGYPDGLKGEQIPLLARIVAVADTFDAVTTNRPYQQAYSLADAVATIRRLVGSRFDAKVVTAFLRAYERGEVRLPREVAQPRPAAVGA